MTSEKPWGGRFSEKTAASVEAFTASVHYDARLYAHDIAGSKAHATMLTAQGILTVAERDAICQGLDEIFREIEAGTFSFSPELEDVHMNIEKALTDRIGPTGAKLHSARSRNDQIALDLRLYLREQCDRLDALLAATQGALVARARQYLGAIMPGYTHLQRAQPVLLSHHLLAYYEMFGRDRDRFADCRKRLNLSPLGSAAMAGTSLPVNREMLADLLGFAGVTANSMDTSGDRDFAIEFVSCCVQTHLHLSRLAEELVLWSSQEFAFVNIADRFCTGSSIMPQKKNPDIPELIRGKTGRVVGDLMALVTMMKGLPLTYNRDLQEDKEQVFDAVDTVAASLTIAAELLENISFNLDRMRAAASHGCLTATDLAEYLVEKGVPFREAHGIVGRVVARCLERECEPDQLSLTELRAFSGSIDENVYGRLTLEGSVNSRLATGNTGLPRVTEALEKAEQFLGKRT